MEVDVNQLNIEPGQVVGIAVLDTACLDVENQVIDLATVLSPISEL